MKQLPKEKRERLLLVGVGTVVCLVGIWYGLIHVQQTSLERIAKTIAENEAKLGSAERLISSTVQLQEQLEDVTRRLEGIEGSMAAGDMYSWVIQTVSKFRADRKVDIPQFSREVSTEVGLLPGFPYKAVLFNLRGTAYFQDLGAFLADFENEFPYLRVQNLELEPAANSSATSTGENEKLAFRMELVALVHPIGGPK